MQCIQFTAWRKTYLTQNTKEKNPSLFESVIYLRRIKKTKVGDILNINSVYDLSYYLVYCTTIMSGGRYNHVYIIMIQAMYNHRD